MTCPYRVLVLLPTGGTHVVLATSREIAGHVAFKQAQEYGPGTEVEILHLEQVLEHRADGTVGIVPDHGDVQ